MDKAIDGLTSYAKGMIMGMGAMTGVLAVAWFGGEWKGSVDQFHKHQVEQNAKQSAQNDRFNERLTILERK